MSFCGYLKPLIDDCARNMFHNAEMFLIGLGVGFVAYHFYFGKRKRKKKKGFESDNA